jgi:predicted small lipoprotein YifL
METMTAKTAATTLAGLACVLAMSLLAGCGNKGPLVKPSDIPPPMAMPAVDMPAAPAPDPSAAPDASDTAPVPDAPAPGAPAPPAPEAQPAAPPGGAG